MRERGPQSFLKIMCEVLLTLHGKLYLLGGEDGAKMSKARDTGGEVMGTKVGM